MFIYANFFAFKSNCPTFSLILFNTSDLLHLFSFIQFYKCLSPFPLSLSPPPSIPPSPSYPPSLPSHPSLPLLTSPLPPCFSLLLLPQSFHPPIHPSILLSLPPTSCTYLKLCKEWLDLRPAATATAPLSPMVFLLRLHYIIQSETHTHMY